MSLVMIVSSTLESRGGCGLYCRFHVYEKQLESTSCHPYHANMGGIFYTSVVQRVTRMTFFKQHIFKTGALFVTYNNWLV
jgi:hypothetical protein